MFGFTVMRTSELLALRDDLRESEGSLARSRAEYEAAMEAVKYQSRVVREGGQTVAAKDLRIRELAEENGRMRAGRTELNLAMLDLERLRDFLRRLTGDPPAEFQRSGKDQGSGQSQPVA